MDVSLSELWELVMDREAWHAAIHRVAKIRTRLSDCTELKRLPTTSWQIDGETMEIVRDLILGGSQITADGDCSHEIKRRLLLGHWKD